MRHYALLALLLSASIYMGVASAQDQSDLARLDRQTVEEYLIDYGYLEGRRDDTVVSGYEFRRALRQFQRENNLTVVNGRITPETITVIKQKKEVQMVIEYLKKYNYIQDYDRRYQIPNAVKWLQRNSGELDVNGVIDSATINFVKSHQRGFAEPIHE
jgi:peptidoglycan hydrolase-like protein with peptidoglycan-binding domain